MSPTVNGVHLLIVDDHARSRESVAAALRAAGYAVEACASAVEGLAHLRRHACQVVITDLQMPGMNGLEFIREIERLGLPTEVLMITAHASVDTAVEAMRHGAFDYIEKPFDVQRLEDAVASASLAAEGNGCGRQVRDRANHGGRKPGYASPLQADRTDCLY